MDAAGKSVQNNDDWYEEDNDRHEVGIVCVVYETCSMFVSV